MRTPFLRREAGSLINRTVTIRTLADFRHPRTGSTALLLSTTTELFITDLVSQHDPQANPQLACHHHTCLPRTLLHQLATIETFQLRITACGMSTGSFQRKRNSGLPCLVIFPSRRRLPLERSCGMSPT